MICRCSAFPWPHSWRLAQRCRDEFRLARYAALAEDGWRLYDEVAEEARSDARERAAEMRGARWP